MLNNAQRIAFGSLKHVRGNKMENMIEVKNLTKKYNGKTVVDKISFTVSKGSLFTFLGTNGAGKSTTINIICTVLKSTTGEVYVDGLNVAQDKQTIREKIGIVYQQNVLDDLLTVKENLLFRASLYGITGESFQKKLTQLADYLDFKNYLNQRFGTLSGGQKRRVEIARAIFHQPQLLLLDEPTTGLDPESRQRVWEIIWDLKQRLGMTVFLTTHYLDEARNSDLIEVIDQGKIIAKGTANELQTQYSSDRFYLYAKKGKISELESVLAKEKFDFTKEGEKLKLVGTSLKEVHTILQKAETSLDSFEFFKGDLDDAFLNLIKQNGGNIYD